MIASRTGAQLPPFFAGCAAADAVPRLSPRHLVQYRHFNKARLRARTTSSTNSSQYDASTGQSFHFGRWCPRRSSNQHQLRLVDAPVADPVPPSSVTHHWRWSSQR